jgi:hypothetical protein
VECPLELADSIVLPLSFAESLLPVTHKVPSAFVAILALLVLPWEANAATIKKVQSGTASSTGNGTVTVTISSVDTTKSFLIFQTRSNSNRPPGSTLRGQLASSTTIDFTRVTNETSTIDIQWYVVEFSAGVRVQRGTISEGASPVNLSITPVAALSQTFVIWSKSVIDVDSGWGNDDAVVLELTTTSNLQLRANYEASAHIIAWQVIEFTTSADILVQKGSTSLTASTSSVDVTLSTAVDLTKAFVLTGFQNTTTSTSSIGRRLIRARLINTNTIRFDRDITDPGDTINEIGWQVVELRDGSKVQSGSVNFPSGTALQTISITSVDTTRAIAFASVQPACGQSLGKTPYAGDDIIGVASATFALSSTDITARRANTASSADIGWFTLEFADPCAAPSTPRANILFVVPNASSLGTSDTAKQCAMHSWNLGVSLISETATTLQFDTAISSADAIYVSSTVTASSVNSKLANRSIGIAWEVPGLDDDFALTDAAGATFSATAIDIVSTCHYITSSFSTGTRTILSSTQFMANTSVNLADDAFLLAKQVGLTSPVLVAVERRNRLYDTTRSLGRRVHLPWGGTSFDYTALNTDGQLLMRRGIEWVAEVDGTLGIWRFDETSGTTAADSSGNGRNATLTNMDPTTDWCKGRDDNALDFDGVDDTAVVSGTFTPPSTGTVAFFMQVPGPPALHGRIFGSGGNWEVRHVNAGNPDGVPYGIVFDLGDPAIVANTDFITTTPINEPNRWYHIAAVFNQPSSTYSVYLDGALHKSGTKTLVAEAAGILTIGTRTGTTNFFVGKLDDLRIYDRELCADEVAALARARNNVTVGRWIEYRNKP